MAEPAVAPRRVLAVHGAGGGGWEWDLWRPVFAAAGWTLHAPDLQPAAGGLAATGFDDYLDQLRGHAEDFRPAVLVGASLGGLLALALAAGHPPRALVLVNPLPPLPEAARMPAAESFPPIVRWGSRARFASTAAALPGADIGTTLAAHRLWRDESGSLLNAARAGIALDAPAVPLLVVASEADEDVPVALSAALAQRLCGSLLRLPGGHIEPLLGAGATQVAEHVVGWLNGLSGFRSN